MNGHPHTSTEGSTSMASTSTAVGTAGGGPKKRVPLTTDASAPPPKKARIADDQGPPANRSDHEHDQDDPDEEEEVQDPKLEAFRKEAIYREMISYKRQLLRAQSETDKLRAQRIAYQVRVSRVEQEWTALVAEANLRLPSASASTSTSSAAAADVVADPEEVDVDALLGMSDQELDEALARRSSATLALLARVQSVQTGAAGASDLEQRCAELVAQDAASRQHLRILRAEHAEALDRLDETHARLVRVERKLDRMQSRTVAELEGRPDPSSSTAAGGSSAAGGLGGGAPASERTASATTPLAGGDGRDSPLAGPVNGAASSASAAAAASDPSSGPAAFGNLAAADEAAKARQELESLREAVGRRAREVEELRSDRVALKNEIDQLKVKLVDLPDDIVSEQPLFKTMQQHVQFLGSEYDSKRTEAEKAVKEADELREGMESFREALLRDVKTQAGELQSRLATRESEVARIRSNRDELKAEVSELRAKDSDKLHALSEMKTLAEARRSRLQAYASELRRLRIGQAGDRGDLEGVQLRVRHAEAAAAATDEMEEGEVEVGEDEVAKDLQKRLTKAEELLRALGEQLRAYASASSASSSSAASSSGGGNPSGPNVQALIESETRARSDLVEARHRVEKLEAILGPGGRADVREMAARLEEKAAELKAAEAKATSQEATATMLYSEIERLSDAWQALDEQNASKVFNLATIEEKLQRLSAEKAKADNRYFTTMRQKDALVNENAMLNKLVEKQQQKVEAANEQQQLLTQQLTQIEKEISLHQANVRAYQEEISSLKRENGSFAAQREQDERTITQLKDQLAERVGEAETEAAGRKRADEQLEQIRRQVEQLQNKAAATASTASGASDPAEVRELKKYNDDLLRMLRCGTCNTRWRSCVITRCGHTFCRECVDARLSSRARRCGACGSSFAASDVGALYF
ncbi:hypothetical protein JCM3774_004477 [Rhodotorula dairenensis]